MENHKPSFAFFLRSALFLIPFILLAFATGDNKSQYVIPGGARTVCTSDIDNDQDLDIITGHNVGWGYTNKSVSVLENIDEGIFAVKDTSKSFCGYQENIFTICVDDDSLPDLVVFHSDFSSGIKRYVRVYYNNEGNFDNFSDFNLNSDETFSYINHGKINNDDFEDVVVISNNGFFWGVMYNDGNGGFCTPQYYEIDWPPTDIACGDLNNDGRDDIIVAGSKLVAYYSYDTGFIYDSIGYQKGRIQLTDLDKDEDLDIVSISELFSYTLVTLFENLGYGFYLSHDCGYYSPNCWYIFISDLNNDSLPDIITTSVNNGVYLLYNEGNFQLSDPLFISVPLVGYDFVNACSADLDKNGFNDLIITQTNAHFINLLFNDGQGNFVENPITKIQNPISKFQKQKFNCFPNPFRHSTQICFEIENTSSVAISIYDFTGKCIRSFDQSMTDRGLHCYKFCSDGLIAGIYFCDIEINGKVRNVTKLVIIK
jgi:hypothetical protein